MARNVPRLRQGDSTSIQEYSYPDAANRNLFKIKKYVSTMFGHGPLSQAELIDAAQATERVFEWEEKRLKRLEISRNQRHVLKGKMNMQNMLAVHLTNTFPKDGVIKTSNHYTKEVDGKKIRFPRHSIHFALNGPVGSHGGGDWTGCKYAVIIPLNKISNRIVTLNPVDTWVIGNLPLPRGSVVLVPMKEKGKNAGNARVLGVEGDMHQGVKDFIQKQGIPISIIGMWGWDFDAEQRELASRLIMGGLNPLNSYDGGKFTEFAEKLGYQVGYHMSSIFYEIEETFNAVALILPTFYDKNRKSGGTSVKKIEQQIKNVEYYQDKLKEFHTKREKQSFTSSERISLEKIRKALDHCITELKLYLHKVRRVHDGIVGKVENIESLAQNERKWLIRESSILKELKVAAGRHRQKKINTLMRKIGRVERRVYRKYQQLKKQLEELSQDHNFTTDISDLLKELEVYEVYLAKFLSLGSNFVREKAKKDWNRVSNVLSKIEKYIINTEEMLKAMNDVLASRVKKFNEEF